MRHYSIYLLKDDVANDYFGKESILYQLFLEHEQTRKSEDDIIKRQIAYITRQIPVTKIQFQLQKELKAFRGYSNHENTHMLTLKRKHHLSEAELSVYSSHMTLSSTGGYEAETIFFETLRKTCPSFLAMDFNVNRYGWLNPIKQRNYV